MQEDNLNIDGFDDAEKIIVAPESIDVNREDGDAVIIDLDKVQPIDVEWLWRDRIALGKITLLSGNPGLGKSFVTMDMAARVTTGYPWPDDVYTKREPGNVLLLNCEDDAADTIRPRLDAAGADVSRIKMIDAVMHRKKYKHDEGDKPRIVDMQFDLTRDIQTMENVIVTMGGCKLIVIDPISAYTGDVDSHKNAELRAVLGPLAAMAARNKVAILCIQHLNKAVGQDAIYRSSGSVAFVAQARAAWVICKDKDDPEERRRKMLPSKNNLAVDVSTGLAYSICSEGCQRSARVVWERGPLSETIDEAMRPSREESNTPVLDSASEFLESVLADGPQRVEVIKKEAVGAGFTFATLRRSKDILHIVVKRYSGFDSYWTWQLPDGQVSDDYTKRVEHPVEDSKVFTDSRKSPTPMQTMSALESGGGEPLEKPPSRPANEDSKALISKKSTPPHEHLEKTGGTPQEENGADGHRGVSKPKKDITSYNKKSTPSKSVDIDDENDTVDGVPF